MNEKNSQKMVEKLILFISCSDRKLIKLQRIRHQKESHKTKWLGNYVCNLCNFRICPVSIRSPNFPDKSVRCLSARIILFITLFIIYICLDSVRCPKSVRMSEKKLSIVCLSDRTRTKLCLPDFHCPCLPTSALY